MNTAWKSILNLVIVAAVSVGLLFGMNAITQTVIERQTGNEVEKEFSSILKADKYEVMDTSGAADIVSAYRALDKSGKLIGYAVTSKVKGYGGDMLVYVALSPDVRTFLGLRIGTHQESPGYGAKTTEPEFYSQFDNLTVPATVQGYTGVEGMEGSLPEQDKGSSELTKHWKDGTYRATEKDFENGYKGYVELTIKDGKITAVNWDADSEDGKTSKKKLSRAGQYKMTEDGKPYHEQAEIMEKALIETQDPTKISIENDTGKTDAYAGVSITISQFVYLSTEALGMASDATATMKDGTYRAQSADYDSGYRDYVSITVKDGKITAVHWDADSEDGKTSKRKLVEEGKYTMTEDGKTWTEQAEIMEKELIAKQDPSLISVREDTGKTDAYAGVSITVSAFTQLAEQAVQQAKGITGTPDTDTETKSEETDGGGIDGVTGATVSSKAVVKAANQAYVFLLEYQGTGVSK